MRAFSYDGSFEGLLCVVFDAYTRKEFPDRLLPQGEIVPLGVTIAHIVTTNMEHAGRVSCALQNKMSAEAFADLLYAWLSEEPGREMMLFRYIRKIFDSHTVLETNYADEDVRAVRLLSRKVCHDRHLLLGFLRFQKTAEDIYFAVVSPKYNVVPLMLSHFRDRFADQKWIIYDVGREFGYYYDLRDTHEMHMDASLLQGGKLDTSLLAENEQLFQEFWKQYRTSLTIKERYNPKLQRTLMPRRYWKYMTEMQR